MSSSVVRVRGDEERCFGLTMGRDCAGEFRTLLEDDIMGVGIYVAVGGSLDISGPGRPETEEERRWVLVVS